MVTSVKTDDGGTKIEHGHINFDKKVQKQINGKIEEELFPY